MLKFDRDVIFLLTDCFNGNVDMRIGWKVYYINIFFYKPRDVPVTEAK